MRSDSSTPAAPWPPKDVSAESQELADITTEALDAVDRALMGARTQLILQRIMRGYDIV